MELFLVRHAMPALRPDASPESWGLSSQGRESALALRTRLPWAAVAVASTETKAVETLRLAVGEEQGRPPTTDEGFGEILRPGEPFDDGVVPRRRAWVEGRPDDRHAGWESPAEAAARFQRAVDRHRPAAGPLIVVTHGMVMTAWLTSIGQIAAGEAAGTFWSGLAFPDVVRLSLS